MGVQCTRLLAVIALSAVVACGGGGGSGSGSGAGNTSASGSQYSLTPTQIPISAQDKLVTVALQQGAVGAVIINALSAPSTGAGNQVQLGPLSAAQISPTLSTKATAKVVAGKVQLVSPTFSTTVKVPDPNDPNRKINLTVSVNCDTSSIPTSVYVKKAWALNLTTGDLLVNMDYPSAVTATYDASAQKFSSCAFTYANGFFIIYGDGSTSGQVDSALAQAAPGPACAGYIGPSGLRVIAAGDPSRNNTSVPLINDYASTSSVDFGTGTNSVGTLCGSLRAFDYVNRAVPLVTAVSFGSDVLPANKNFLVDASSNIYAIGSDLGYGGDAIKDSCPIIVTRAGASTPVCIGIQNQSSYIRYPVSASQLQAAGIGNSVTVQKPYASMLLDSNGSPTLSLQTYSGGCNFGSCFGTLAAPALFAINPGLSVANNLGAAALSAAYPWGATSAAPVGASNDYLVFAGAGGGPNMGLLVNINSGQVVRTCTNIDSGVDNGCSAAVSLGDYVYGMTFCAFQGAAPDVCINSPQVGRANTRTGVSQNWDLKTLGYLPLSGMSNSSNTMSLPVPPIFYTDRVVFLACPSPNLSCPAPNWVSFNYATGQVTAITTGGITFDMLPTLIGTTLWNSGG